MLDVVRKEFKEHMREMGNKRNRFEDQNSHPNVDSVKVQEQSFSIKQPNCISTRAHLPVRSSIDKGFKYNPFFDMS